jgi:hypothetical protein
MADSDERWDETYLLEHSGLPGPRANLELVQRVADAGTLEQFQRWLSIDADAAPSNTAREFLPLCGAVGLGRLIAEGQVELLDDLRRHASDRRWRTREGVAMGLQRLGERDMPRLLAAMRDWSTGSWLERRAAVAALCEPALLRDAATVTAVLRLLDQITGSIASALDRRADDFRVLRQALGYAWSVAIAAEPRSGRALFDKWRASENADVQWIVRENLKKNRLKNIYGAQSHDTR